MKTNTKVHNVVMLPTDKGSKIAIVCNELVHVSNKVYNPYEHKEFEKEYLDTENHTVPQHIYFTSNDPVTSNDTWVIFRGNEVVNIKDYAGTTSGFKEQCKKIVATTDNINTNPEEENYTRNWLPNIPESFIKAYIANTSITEVNLEMTDKCNGICMEIAHDHSDNAKACLGDCKAVEIKKRSIDNTVIIHQAKLITKDEMHLNMQYYMEHCQREGYVTPQEWITKHKHF